MKNNLGRRNKMKDKINSILSEAKGKISDAVSEGELQNVKRVYRKAGFIKSFDERDPYSGCGASS